MIAAFGTCSHREVRCYIIYRLFILSDERLAFLEQLIFPTSPFHFFSPQTVPPYDSRGTKTPYFSTFPSTSFPIAIFLQHRIRCGSNGGPSGNAIISTGMACGQKFWSIPTLTGSLFDCNARLDPRTRDWNTGCSAATSPLPANCIFSTPRIGLHRASLCL